MPEGVVTRRRQFEREDQLHGKAAWIRDARQRGHIGRYWRNTCGRCTLPIVKAYVGVTDGDWYRFLADRPTLNEVNFWRPSGGRGFGVLTPGEPFFFKTPHNRVVGGGFYSGFAPLPISAARELFGEGNGVDSFPQMRARVGKYRRQFISGGEGPEIGCVFVRDTVFFLPDAVAEPPPSSRPTSCRARATT